MRAWRSIGSWLLLLALLTLAPLLARSAPATATMAPAGAPTLLGAWDEGFHLPGIYHASTSSVDVMVSDSQGNVYIGGSFSSVFGVRANNIARWDGEHWSALGAGVNGPVRALVIDAEGSLYVGGSFGTAGGIVGLRGLARWDGTTWHFVGQPLQNGSVGIPEVYALALAPNNEGVYVGGNFWVNANPFISNLAYWDGQDWQRLRYGVEGTVSSLVMDPAGSLYVAGEFTEVDGSPAMNIARWDGTAWYPLGQGLPRRSVLTMGSDGNLYAGATVVQCQIRFCRSLPDSAAGDTYTNTVRRWDGQSWSTLSQPGDGFIRDLTWGADGHLYAGGPFISFDGESTIRHLAQWDGTDWSPVQEGSDEGVHGPVDALRWIGGRLWIGGNFTRVGGHSASGIITWDGGAWQLLGGGDGVYEKIFDLATDPSGNVYAVGTFEIASPPFLARMARWDGSQWHSMGWETSPYAASTPKLLTIAEDGTLYTVVDDTIILKGDKAGWTEIGRAWVNALVVDETGQLYVGGRFSTIGGITARKVARWDGTQWHPLGEGLGLDQSGQVHALTLDETGNLYAGGNFYALEGRLNLARWDGSTWHEVGGGTNGVVNALEVGAAGTLYVGGAFTVAGTIPANRIARWDGTQWSPMGEGFQLLYEGGDPYVKEMVKDEQGGLYVIGRFNYSGPLLTVNTAYWNGNQWQPLGEGITARFTGGVFALDIVGDDAYFGGDFSTAGNFPAASFARWRHYEEPPATATPTATVSPSGTAVPTATPMGTATPTGASTRLYLPLIAR